MITFRINDIPVVVEEGTSILEAALMHGFPIPTLCHKDGLSPYGACRLCIVEIGDEHEPIVVSSCTYPAQENLRVRTATEKIIHSRKIILELMLASSPQSKIIRDIAASYSVHRQRFKQENENCILCGLCVRMCEEQMMAKALGFKGRGTERSVGIPFDKESEVCRDCGGCIYVCPVCQLHTTIPELEDTICSTCSATSSFFEQDSDDSILRASREEE